jgi:molecular chaperone IbpA
MRTAYDFSPLYRSTVGFDRLFDMLDHAAGADAPATWPPYNVERKSENEYRISMAVAGFGPDEIDITQHGNTLLVGGQRKPEQENSQVLYRGISSRNFKQTFGLADYMKVAAADLQNGVLTIDLLREVPERLKPRRIEIATRGERLNGPQDGPTQIGPESGQQRQAA